MLNIWFRGGENPDGTPIEVIDAIDFYFKYLFDEEWMEDPFVKEMIRDVDKSEVVAPHIYRKSSSWANSPRSVIRRCKDFNDDIENRRIYF